MGLFCVSFHVQTTNVDSLSAALDRRGMQRRRVLPAKNGWTSLYEERSSQQDDARIRDLASGLSRDLKVAAIAFLVHDSDMACYWLYDQGNLLDEYNSCPDYFDADGPEDESPAPSGGKTEVLVRFCRPGVQEDELAAILAEQATFAEDTIGQLAIALGIDRDRALADYKDGVGGGPATDASDDDDDDDGGPIIIPRGPALAGRLAQMLGGTTQATAADPKVAALVRGAVEDDSAAIERLLAEGTPVDAEAPAPMGGGSGSPGLKQLLPGGVPNFTMTALLAAVLHKRRAALQQLLQGGADPNRNHEVFGTAVHRRHCGRRSGNVLQLLIEHGGDVNAHNTHGQTPLQVLAAAPRDPGTVGPSPSIDEIDGHESTGPRQPTGEYHLTHGRLGCL